ncbi:MAG: hypothetical protein VB106_11340 [Clostridiaceae bacterium]|nr:hypothetical protein [Clostridiaceae bacterium]
MRIIPEKFLKEMEKNIYSGISLSKGAIIFLWTLLCVLLINKKASGLYTVFFGILFYISLFVLCLILFKDIRRYLVFPKEDKILPRFIGYKPDIIFIYPVFLMSLIGAINNLLIASGFFPEALQRMSVEAVEPIDFIARITLLPFVAFSEELFNLLLVSLFYNKVKFPGSFRLIAGMLSATLTFSILHSVGWGLSTAVLTGISYIPVFFVTLYTGNIWISFLAHFYNDLVSVSKSYYGSLHFVMIAVICLIPVLWSIRTMVRKTR